MQSQACLAAVYTVKIGLKPSCSCPDAIKGGRLCKHHYFCMLRVLKLPEDDPRVWQRGLLPEEVRLRGGGSGGVLLHHPCWCFAVRSVCNRLCKQRFTCMLRILKLPDIALSAGACCLMRCTMHSALANETQTDHLRWSMVSLQSALRPLL